MAEEKNRKRPPDVADLRTYRSRRDFKKTAEPPGGIPKPSPAPIFVVQKHAARRLHYDLRLEADGVLKSWAVPRGPSYDPGEKRLAVHVEDHPLEYADFEGLIAENQYGAGTVMVWDRGTWSAVGDWRKGLETGKLTFRLEGTKLKGTWKLIRIKERQDEEFESASHDNWLLIKAHDEGAGHPLNFDETEENVSVKTGRTMEQITEQKNAFWQGSRTVTPPARRELQKAPAPPPAPGAEAPWPDSFFPQLATLVSRLPEGNQWISEIKYDGYRLLAMIRQGRVTLVTRRGLDWTETFPAIARELSRLPVKNAVLDGEVVVMNPDGTTNFQKLQNIMKHREEGSLLYYVFDIPYYQDHDLSPVTLLERKMVVRELISTYQERLPSIRYSDHLEGSGERILRAACDHAVEGIIAKLSEGPYVQKRTKYWVKKKCINRQEFVVGGYTAPKGTRSLFGSLLLGYYNDAHQLIYCGNMGTGFSEKTIGIVYEQMKNLEQDTSPFAFPIDDARHRGVQWIAPRLVAEVEFADWTEDGRLRQPSFVGLREDKKPDEITLEKETTPPEEPVTREEAAAAPAIPIKLTNPGKVLYPEPGVTKKDLAEYYLRVAHEMLPEAMNRPLVLVRCPEGIGQDMREKCFFQKHLRDEVPEGVRTVPIEEKGEIGLYPVVDEVKGILALAQLGVLEIHMLGCRADDVAHPDRMIFDLDPAIDVSKERMIEASFYIRDFLEKNGLKAFLKLTGGKGIHIVVPLKPGMNWEELKKVSRAIAFELVHAKADWFTATVSKRRRTGKILIDYLRNSLGASTIVPWSTRANPEASVAFPVSWNELTVDLLSRPLTVRNVMGRMNRIKENPWKEINEE